MRRKNRTMMILLLFAVISVFPAVGYCQHEESGTAVHSEEAVVEDSTVTEPETVATESTTEATETETTSASPADVETGHETTVEETAAPAHETMTHETESHSTSVHGEETTAAHGGEEHEGHESTPWYRDFNLWKFINLGVLILILYKLLGAPLGKFFQDRSKSIEEMLKSAEEERELARKDLETIKQNIAEATEEINSILAKGKTDAEKAIQEIEENTASEIEIIKKRTSDELEQELMSIRQDLVTFVAKEAVGKAKEKIEKMNLSNLQAGYVKQFQKTLNVQGGNGEKP